MDIEQYTCNLLLSNEKYQNRQNISLIENKHVDDYMRVLGYIFQLILQHARQASLELIYTISYWNIVILLIHVTYCQVQASDQ